MDMERRKPSGNRQRRMNENQFETDTRKLLQMDDRHKVDKQILMLEDPLTMYVYPNSFGGMDENQNKP